MDVSSGEEVGLSPEMDSCLEWKAAHPFCSILGSWLLTLSGVQEYEDWIFRSFNFAPAVGDLVVWSVHVECLEPASLEKLLLGRRLMAFGQNHSRYDPLLWQATLESFVRHLKHLHSIDETNLVQRSPRQLTTEAIYTIYVMVTFVTLSLLGTLLTLYEHLCKAKENNNNSRKNGIVTCKTTQKKPPAHHFTKGNCTLVKNEKLCFQ
ncbi:uncharacterized protein TNCV_4725161 [Trichonephila clavipes]|uniref:Uncharacterized protein n=1 Tax=Trichonephila clavipes TaxID=2585209 RepID=A0A8X7BG77_TRICX|nr:uncharacterized protein TNCV_4725161 [Trichonephila clavipes]